MEAPGAGDAAAAAAAAASEGKKAKKQKKKDKKEKQKAKKKAKKDKKKAKKLKKKEKRLQRKLKKLERNKLSSSSSSSSSTSSSSSSSSGPPSPPREKMRRRDEAAPLGGDAALPAFRSSRPPVEKSRESLSLKLLGEIYAAKQGAAKGPRWRYPLRDESRRCFAGLLSPEIPDETLNRFRERIARTTTWGQPVSPKTGEPIPRKTAWMVAGKCKCTYKYGGVEVEPVEFPRWMSELMEACMPFCGLPSKEHWPNCCNLNLYDDGGMSVGWHADDEQLFQGRMKAAWLCQQAMATLSNLFSLTWCRESSSCCQDAETEAQVETVLSFAVVDEVHRMDKFEDDEGARYKMSIHAPEETGLRGEIARTDEVGRAARPTEAEVERADADDGVFRDAPHQAASEISICIPRSKPREPLGMQLDFADSRLLHVCALKPDDCPVALHNKRAPEEEQLRVGDYIVEVNGQRGNSLAMMREIQDSPSLRVAVRRPFEFSVDVDKRGGTLGLDVNHVSKAVSLVVEDVLPGPVQEWNAAKPGLAVQRGDRIVSVNDVLGHTQGPQALLRGLGASNQLRLVLTRPAGPELQSPEGQVMKVLSNAPKTRHGGA